MNPLTFGYDGWNFLHGLPWQFQSSVLSSSDLSSIVIIGLFTIKLIPCKTCCNDGHSLLKKMNWTRHLYVHSKSKIATRGSVARFFFLFHDKVNDKLKKPKWSDDWKKSILPRRDWIQSFVRLITIIAWNFPNPEDWKKTHDKSNEISSLFIYDKEQLLFLYKFYFQCVVPRVFKLTPFGDLYDEFLMKNSLSSLQLMNKTNFTRWFSKFRTLLSKHPEWEGSLWGFQEMNTFASSFGSKEECGKVERPSTIFQGCQ